MSALTHRREAGFSLVELMVALAIGTFLLAGTISVFGKTRDLYRTNDAGKRFEPVSRQPKGVMPSHAAFDSNGVL